MSFSPYLIFTGNAREAMTAYAEIFGASDLQLMTFGQMPEGVPPQSEDLIMHAQFSAGEGAPLMGADMPAGTQGGGPRATVFHGATDPARAEQIFTALAEGGNVIMPLAATFWSPAFGMVMDRFGTTWMISLTA